MAYTARFLIAVFGPGPATAVGPRRIGLTLPAVVLAGGGVIGYVAIDAVNSIVRPAAIELNTKAQIYSLVQWPGIKTAFAVSMMILAAGSLLGAAIARREASPAPSPVGADTTDALIDGILDWAPRITARVQHGSLPVYLATVGAAASVAAVPFVVELSTDHLVWWDTPLQGALAAAIVCSAVAGAFVGSRLGAALTLGAVGIGVSGLFVVHGAPDLALTQLLVETVVVVGFVIGLGHLAQGFPSVENTWRVVRLVIAGAGGLAVTAGLVAAGANPAGRAPVEELARVSVDEGGGKNVVNVILTDIRALDTLGEVVVLATVAIGILALAKTRHMESAP
ncbi:MAG: DUF4040 domain-containing protein [Actinomycetia bacterium]|nr:DUF4040 domain-containing protein [Actinomycetes bacterium]